MSKNLKRVLSGVLSAAVIAGAAPMTALAANAAAGNTNSTVNNGDGFVDGALLYSLEEIEGGHIIKDTSDYYSKTIGDFNNLTPSSAPGAALPSKVDNSKNQNAKYIPQVRSQGSIGSCCAWSSVYYQFTYTKNKARGVATTDANTYSPNFVFNFNNYGSTSSGSSLIKNYSTLMNHGAPTISDVPLLDSTYPATNCKDWFAHDEVWANAAKNRMTDYQVFANGAISSGKGTYVKPIPNYGTVIYDPTDSRLDAMKTALNNGEILTFCTYFRGWQLTPIKSAYSSNNPNGYTVDNSYVGKNTVIATVKPDPLTSHEMTIVGYNDEIWTDVNNNGVVDRGEMGAFRILNSHGKNYEDSGYIWLSYDSMNAVSAVSGAPSYTNREMSMWSVARMEVSSKQDDSSGIFLKYVLNSNYRADNEVTVTAYKNGSKVKSMSVTPYNYYASDEQWIDEEFNSKTYDFIQHKIGYRGEDEVYSDGTMYFDLNNIVSNINSTNLKDYTWTVTVADKTNDGYKLTVKELKIVDKKAGKEYNMNQSSNFVLDGTSKNVNIPITNPAPANAITIYYKGYSTPYIHYQVGTGSWTAVPGVRMTATNEVSGYTHKYTIQLGSASFANVCFNNGSGTWDSRNGANYRFTKGTFTYSNGTIKTYTPPVPQELSLSINSFDSTVPAGGAFNVTASAQGGTAPYQYKFSYVNNNSNYGTYETQVQGFSSSNSARYNLTQSGYYTIKVSVKDSTGKTVEKTTNVTAVSVTLYGISSDKASPKTGDKIKFSGSVYSNGTKLTYKYTVSGNGTTQTLTTNSDNTAYWTPSKEGTYNAKLELIYGGVTIVSSSMTVNVQKGTDPVPTNSITIYYKGYSTPYIHYQVGTGSWTAVPGVRMTATNEVSGYTHKYTINLGSASYANVCFNNGNGTWDSKNGQNYRFTKGTFTYSNGTIKTYSNPVPQELSLNLSLSDSYVPASGNFTISASAQGGTAPYQYQFSYIGSYENTVQSYSSTSSVNCSIPQNGTYTVKAIVKDATGKTVQKTTTINVVAVNLNSISANKTSPKVGESVTLSSNVTTNNVKVSYRYSIVNSNGTAQSLTTNSNNTATWTPTAAGTYTARVELYYGSKPLGSKGISITVQKADVSVNAITVYYKGYANPKIHYQVGNGSWTPVPGYSMTRTSEKSGYTHKYTIQLGSASYAYVCFNDGNGNWDSRNGQNYYFGGKGTYTYYNGSVTKISTTPSSTAPASTALKNTSTVSAAEISKGQKVTVKCASKGGNGDVKYSVSYKKASSSKWTLKQSFSENTKLSIKPAASTTYEVCVKAKDSTGKVVKKYFTITVK